MLTGDENIIHWGKPQPLLTDYGPILFGGAVRPVAVDWFEHGKLDLVVGGTGGHVILYERLGGTAEQPEFALPVIIGTIPSYVSLPLVFDWNRDGVKDLLVGGRDTLIYLFKNIGTNERPKMEFAGPLKDENGLVFSIENADAHSMRGYLDARFFNYLSPAVCDWYSNGGDDLLFSDSRGNIWILEDISQGKGKPCYRGEKYRKANQENGLSSYAREHGQSLIREYGRYYSRPLKKLCYADGTIVDKRVGIALCNWGSHGGVDLLTAGRYPDADPCVEFIENVGVDEHGDPQLYNRGPISVNGQPIIIRNNSGFCVCDWGGSGRPELLVSEWSILSYYRTLNVTGVPQLSRTSVFYGTDTPLNAGYISMSIDWTGNGLPDLLEGSWEGFVNIRENVGTLTEPKFKFDPIPLCDEQGPIRVYGETDPQQGKNGGVSRPVLVDWNNDGVLDLLVGSDTGHIYYYQGVSSQEGGKIPVRFHAMGPLKDTTGRVIKVHNRAAPVVVDTNGNGQLDLVVSGSSYQMGIDMDINPGGDIQVFENLGVDGNGNPSLAPSRIFEVDGNPFTFGLNVHTRLHQGDIDGDGKIEMVFFTKVHGTKVIRNIGTVETPYWHLAETIGDDSFGGLADITGNGLLDAVFGGGEYGGGKYRLNFGRFKDF